RTLSLPSQCMRYTCACNLLGIACIVSVVCACFVPMQRQLLLFSSNSYPSRLIWYVTVHSTLGRHSCLNFFFLLWFSCVFVILKDYCVCVCESVCVYVCVCVDILCSRSVCVCVCLTILLS